MLPDNQNKENVYNKNKLNPIVLAGGCFWGTQAYISGFQASHTPGAVTASTCVCSINGKLTKELMQNA